MRWFEEQFEKQVSGIREKYERSLHTETDDEILVHALLGDRRFVDELARRLGVLQEDLADYDRRVEVLTEGKPYNIDYGDVREPLVKAAGDLRVALVDLVEQLAKIQGHVEYGDFDLAREGEQSLLLGPVLELIGTYRAHENAIDVSALPYSVPPAQEDDYRLKADRTLGSPASYAEEIYDGAHQIIYLLGYLHKPDLHVLGNAGNGKTHLAGWICDDRVSNGLPAIFLSGANFTGDGNLEGQLRGLLDLPSSYSWSDFVRALDAAAKAYRTRIPIVIDGLNETVRNGAFSTVWERHLPGFYGIVSSLSNNPVLQLLDSLGVPIDDA
jgi:hypothetical protein